MATQVNYSSLELFVAFPVFVNAIFAGDGLIYVSCSGEYFECAICCTKASKLIVFQFKLLHRRLATNDYLHKIGLRNDDICTFFCKNGKESLAHLFWHALQRDFFVLEKISRPTHKESSNNKRKELFHGLSIRTKNRCLLPLTTLFLLSCC